MGKWEFYDHDEEVEGMDDKEPSFSFYDFAKWMENQKLPNADLKSDGLGIKKHEDPEEKEALKKKFQKHMGDKISKNIEKKMAERKKNREN